MLIDCASTPDIKLCDHKVMAGKPIVGAGHHVRAKTNIPIIGILTQPIPEDNKIMMN